MEAMLLAAGVGSRLQNLTRSKPKCLIEIAGKPILEWNILRLKAAGALKIVINLHHLADEVTRFLEQHDHFGMEIVYSIEFELLNTGGGLKHAEQHFSGSAPVLVVNADILCSASLRTLYDSHQKSGVAASLLTRDPEDTRVLLFNRDDHQLIGWRNRESAEERLLDSDQPPVERGFCGIQVISPVIFQYLGRPSDKRSSIAAYIDAADAGLSVIEIPADKEYWFDIGTPDQLERCRKYFEGREVLGVKPE